MGCAASASVPPASKTSPAVATPPSALLRSRRRTLEPIVALVDQQAESPASGFGGAAGDTTTVNATPLPSPTPSQSGHPPSSRRVGFASEEGDRASTTSNDTPTHSNSSSFRLHASPAGTAQGAADANWQAHLRRMRKNPLVVGLASKSSSHRIVRTSDRGEQE